MKHLVLTLWFVVAAMVATAQESDSGPEIPHADWRKEIRSEYKYEGPNTDLPVVFSPPSQVLFAPNDQPITKMAPYLVRAPTFNVNALHTAILQSEAQARTDEISAKLGIGVHQTTVAGVTFFAATVFYVPIAVGFGIKW